MTLDGIGGAGVAWLIAALVLGIAELAIPGVFAIFLAIAAAATGIVAFVLPDLSVPLQLVAFAAWAAVAVLIGRRWYLDYPVSSDARLNDRAARLIGEVVTVEAAIAGGRGRVHVGDGSWPAIGADAAVGARVEIVGIRDGMLLVAPIAARD